MVHIVNFEVDLLKDIDDNFVISGSLGAENTHSILFKLHNDKNNLNGLREELIQNYASYTEEQKGEICKNFLKSEIFLNTD